MGGLLSKKWGNILLVSLPGTRQQRSRFEHTTKLYAKEVRLTSGFEARIADIKSKEFGKMKWVCFDLVNDESIQREWMKYLVKARVLIVIADASEPENIRHENSTDTVHYHLHSLLNRQEMKDVIVIIISSTESDKKNMKLNHMVMKLEMNKVKQKWLVFGCDAAGYHKAGDALTWISGMFVEDEEEKEMHMQSGEEQGISYRTCDRVFSQWNSVLLISGVVRKFDQLAKLGIISGITQLIHSYYHNSKHFLYDHKLSFYG